MYRYSSFTDNDKMISNFKFLFKSIIENAINQDGWFNRIPTSIMFVQGIYDYNSKTFIDVMTELGFEHRIYQNIAHGLETDDMQGFFYLDIKEKYINNKQ
jgi:hypothetical protein